MPDSPMRRNEMRALEREIKQTAADAAKVSEEFQLQLDVLRRREEDSAQSYVCFHRLLNERAIIHLKPVCSLSHFLVAFRPFI
jgi:hypothetical protein